MAGQTARIRLNTYTNGETGWGLGTTANWSILDDSPLGHLRPRAQTVATNTLYVAAGVFYSGSTPTYFAGGNTPTFSAPGGDNNRIDLVTINGSGTLAIVQGTPAGSPAPPTYPSTELVICEVYLRSGSSTLYDTDQGAHGYIYRDVRPMVTRPTTGASGVTGVHVTGAGDQTGSIELAEGSGIDLVQTSQKVTVHSLGVLGMGISGQTLMSGGNVWLDAGPGIGLAEDLPNRSIRIYSTAGSPMTNPMTSPGDIIVATNNGVPIRFGIGAEGQVITTSSGNLAWRTPTTGKRAATRTVAANDSLATSKAGTDYQCDNVDDQVQINQAITDLGAVGGSVILMEGTYTISATITLPSNVTLVSYGATIILANSTNSNLSMITIGASVSNIEIRGLILNGNKANQGSYGQSIIEIGAGSSVTIQNCVLTNAKANNMTIYGTTTVVRMENCVISNAGGVGLYLSQTTSCQFRGLRIVDNVGFGIHGFTIINNVFTGLHMSGNQINVYLNPGSIDNVFSGCYFLTSVNDGVYVSGTRNSFIGCVFNRNGTATNNTYAQLVLDGTSTYNAVQSCTFFKGISGNLSKYGIWLKSGSLNNTVYPNAVTNGAGQTADTQNDGTGNYLGPSVSTQRSATYVIAATDATTTQKSGADYVCDGVDDQVQFQAVFDAIQTGGIGGSLTLVGKNFTFASAAHVSDNTTIEGDSQAITIKLANNAVDNVTLFDKHTSGSGVGITLRSLILDGNKANQTNSNQDGLYITGNDLYLDNIVTQNFKRYGMSLSSNIQFSLFSCVAKNNNSDGVYVAGSRYGRISGLWADLNGGNGIYLNGVHDTYLMGATCTDNTGIGIRTASCGNLAIISPKVFRNPGYESTTVSAITVEGGIAVNINGGYIAKHGYGINLSSAAAATTLTGVVVLSENAVTINGATDTKLANCQLESYSRSCVILQNTATRTTINSCTIKSNILSSHGVSIASSSTLTTVTDSMFPTVGDTAIYMDSTTTYNKLDGNYITSGKTGIAVNAVSNTEVINNTVMNTTLYGIYVNGTMSYTRIVSNRLFNNQDYGIWFQGGISARHNVVHDNIVTQNGKSDYSTTGTAIYLYYVPFCSVRDNVIRIAYGRGLHISTCTNSTIAGNRIFDCHQEGLYLHGSQSCLVSENFIQDSSQRTNNTYDQVYVDACGLVTRVINNRVFYNTGATNKPRYAFNFTNSTATVKFDGNVYADGALAPLLNDCTALIRTGIDIDLTIPKSSGNWSWVNQGSSVATNGVDRLTLEFAAAASVNLALLVTAAPVTPYKVTALIRPSWAYGSNSYAGLYWRSSGDSKLSFLGWYNSFYGNEGYVVASKYSSATAFSANYINRTTNTFPPTYLRLEDDGNNRMFKVSNDGVYWITLHSVTRTDFHTPDQIGFGGESGSASYPLGVSLLSWEVS